MGNNKWVQTLKNIFCNRCNRNQITFDIGEGVDSIPGEKHILGFPHEARMRINPVLKFTRKYDDTN